MEPSTFAVAVLLRSVKLVGSSTLAFGAPLLLFWSPVGARFIEDEDRDRPLSRRPVSSPVRSLPAPLQASITTSATSLYLACLPTKTGFSSAWQV